MPKPSCVILDTPFRFAAPHLRPSHFEVGILVTPFDAEEVRFMVALCRPGATIVLVGEEIDPAARLLGEGSVTRSVIDGELVTVVEFKGGYGMVPRTEVR